MRKWLIKSTGIILVFVGCFTAPKHLIAAQVSDSTSWPGSKRDGSFLLPNGWSLRPAGKHVLLGDFPINIAIHPGGRFAAILHSGYSQHEIITVDLKTLKVVSRAEIEESFYGLTFSRDGSVLYCSGAGDEVIHIFRFSDGYLANHYQVPIRDAKKMGIPAGIAVSGDGKQIFVANLWAHRVTELGGDEPRDILIGTNDVLATASTAPAQDFDTEAVTKRAEALLDKTDPNAPFPYGCVLDERRSRLYVSLWGQSSVAVIDTKLREVISRWTVEDHPNEMILDKSGKHLFVANANRNSVSVLDTETGQTIETLLAELKPNSPPGSTPNSLALTPDGKTLFVANANINALAVFDVSIPGRSHSLGFIPTGWYPTSVRVTPDGKKLVYANGKGQISKANRNGPQSGQEPPGDIREYIGSLFQGTMNVVELSSGEKFEQELKDYTAKVFECLPVAARTNAVRTVDNPIPGAASPEKSPIKYCVYIIKENRTYDQVLGDLPQGNGDPTLCLFPRNITPNHHHLAEEFVLLDNFYVDAEVSADGHEWTMGAYATDFVEKMWPLSYGHNSVHKKYHYPAEGNFPIATPAGGYLWDRAKEAGVTYRSYGEFVANAKKHDAPATSRVPALKGHFDPFYWGFDVKYPDVDRAARFISELRRFENEGEMPRLQIVRLPNDHTGGTGAAYHTPSALVADNDLALGQVVEALSRSKFWAQTAIFVVEDDAQNGPDHVDAHRTIAYVISPYVKRHSVDSTLYSTSSMLRTMELILGLKPMSQFDAAAMPMYHSFQAKPNVHAYTALPANIDIKEMNKKTAWGSGLKLNLAKEDAVDDLLLNRIIWRSVKGSKSNMPSPTRAAWVRQTDVDDD
ncbi:MAG: hypothetical protein JWM99_3020 [Verrucomicrobiales bacterium]|nr:hypothetical protein [Verrucomicrobiales bacterium]